MRSSSSQPKNVLEGVHSRNPTQFFLLADSCTLAGDARPVRNVWPKKWKPLWWDDSFTIINDSTVTNPFGSLFVG